MNNHHKIISLANLPELPISASLSSVAEIYFVMLFIM